MSAAARCLLILVACLPLGAGEAPPAPAAPGAAGILGYVLLPSPGRSVDRAVAVADAFQAGAVERDELLESLGEPLGPAGLSAVDLEAPLLAAFLAPAAPMQPPLTVVMASVTAPDDYLRFAEMRGWFAEHADGLLTVAQQAPTDEQGGAIAELYHAAGEIEPGTDARLFLDLAVAHATYGAQLEMLPALLMLGMAGDPQLQQMAPLFQAYVLAFTETLADSALLQADVALDATVQAEAVGLDVLYRAREGSALAGLLSAPAGDPLAGLALLPPGDAVFRGAGAVPAEGMRAWAADLLERVGADPTAAQVLTAEVRQAMADWMEAFGGATAFQMDDALAQEAAWEVTDGDAALAAYEDSLALMEDLMGGLGMGIESGLERDVREVDGVGVHRLTMEAQQPELDPMGMMQSQELAVVEGWLLVGNGDALDAMIARARDGGAAVPLRSIDRFGHGAHVYADYDVVGLMKAMMQQAAQAGLAMGGMIPPEAVGHPVTLASWLAEGSARTRLHVPLRPWIAIGQAFMGQFAPPPPPPGQPRPQPRPQPEPVL